MYETCTQHLSRIKRNKPEVYEAHGFAQQATEGLFEEFWSLSVRKRNSKKFLKVFFHYETNCILLSTQSTLWRMCICHPIWFSILHPTSN